MHVTCAGQTSWETRHGLVGILGEPKFRIKTYIH